MQSLRLYEYFGFNEEGTSGKEIYGTCPFCEKPKFYLNVRQNVWSCKSAICQEQNRQGGVHTFLQNLVNMYKHRTTKDHYTRLSQHRGLKVATLRANNIVFNPDKDEWYVPVKNLDGYLTDLRRWKYGGKSLSCPGGIASLYGGEVLGTSELSDVYICEGEWDTLALREVILDEGVVVGLPGAETFKREWCPVFRNKNVFVLLDNDTAGRKGSERIKQMLTGIAATVNILMWPEGTADKWDVRDQVGILAKDEVKDWFRTHSTGDGVRVDPIELEHGFLTVLDTYKRWLEFNQEVEWGIRCMYAVILSTQLPGDPLWLYIVAPPGGLKSELLMAFSKSQRCVLRSTITAQGLVSGWNGPGGADPSLLPQLNGKTFILKDFTELRSMHRDTRAEVYSLLRGAYDGFVEKSYGNGIQRNYVTHFSMLAGVTQDIHGDNQASLGERFLKYCMLKGGYDPNPMIHRALENVTQENKMREELGLCAVSMIDYFEVSEIPVMEGYQIERLVALSQLVAQLRGSVERDDRERVIYRPQYEVGTRIAKQLKKLALSLALVRGTTTVEDDDYLIMEQVALDSCVGINLEIFALLMERGHLDITELSNGLRIPMDTLTRKLQDLILLGVLQKVDLRIGGAVGRPKGCYQVHPEVVELWESAQIRGEVKWRGK